METMAAVNSFDDVLNTLVTDDEDKGKLSELVAKYPGMRDGWLRQRDYSQKLDAFRDTENKFKDVSRQVEELSGQIAQKDAKIGEIEKWYAENWDTEANMTKAERALKEYATELEGKIGQDMTFDDIGKFIADKGLIDKNTFESTLSQKEQDINKSLQGSAYFTATIAELVGKHQDEFGKPLKVREFVSKFNEYGTTDIDAAYEKYTSDERKARADEARAKEIESIRLEERKKAEEEFRQAQLKNGGLPVDQGEPHSVGHLQAKVQHVGDPEALEKATLGSGSVARIAAEAYRKEQIGVA